MALRKQKGGYKLPSAKESFEALDANRSGTVSFNEFADFLTLHNDHNHHEKYKHNQDDQCQQI